jgi:septal ring factor EnvC (AmiA/AmiB activator)
LALAKLRRQAAEASGDLFSAESELEDRQGRLDAVTGDADLFAPAQAASGQDSQPAPTSLLAPTAGPVAVRFGGRLASGLKADGLAWRTAAGAAVQSPAAAVVAYAGALNGWGEVVILRAGGGCHMVLSGLGKVTVTQGQSVAAAFPLGTMPTDGHAPPELYFEVRMPAGPIDPARLIADRGAFFNAGGLRLRREGAD